MPLTLFHFLTSLSEASDLVCASEANLTNHGKQVAYVCMRIGDRLSLPWEQKRILLYSAIIHDVGICATHKYKELARWDTKDNDHCINGQRLLKPLDSLMPISEVILYHHEKWNNDNTIDRRLGSIINLSNSIVVLIDRSKYILNIYTDIIDFVLNKNAKLFMPEAVDALREIAKEEAFWLDLASPQIDAALADYLDWRELEIGWTDIQAIAQVFSMIIDAKSQFTLEHSMGVTNVACELAVQTGFDETDLSRMVVAGLLHDLGKLSIPDAILEKPGPLSENEMLVIKQHTYYTYRILSRIEGFSDIAKWAAYHHERLDGRGYPFHLQGDELSLGSRIMAVADVFQALNQKRPYRETLPAEEVRKIMLAMTDEGALDKSLVDRVLGDFDRYGAIARRQELLKRKTINDNIS